MPQLSVSAIASQPEVQVSDVRVGEESLGMTVESVSHTAGAFVERATLLGIWADTDPQRLVEKPIQFLWGPNSQKLGFKGYVTKVTKTQSIQKQPEIKIECQGSCFDLKRNRGPRFYKETTGKSIIEELCHKSGIGSKIEDHWYTFDRFAQTGYGDWDTIQQVAEMLGMIVFDFNGVLQVGRPTTMIESISPVAILDKSTTLLNGEQALLDFTPYKISRTDSDVSDDCYGYFSNDAATLVNPSGVDFVTSKFIAGPERARLVTEAIKTSTNFWSNYSTARIRGNVSIIPGTTVSIHTGMSSVAVDSNDGIWLVIEANHIYNRERFQTNLKLVRDKVRTDVSPVAKEPQYWTGDRRSRPSSSLRGGKWVSSWS